jgi:hypothetical protein
MENETGVRTPSLHTLIPLEDFKAVLDLDDRDEALSRFCLMAAAYTIEQYCRRQLLNKKHYETFKFYGDYIFPLRNYPVREVLAVYTMNSEQGTGNNGELVEPDLYRAVPDCGGLEDVPHCLSVSPALRFVRGASSLKVHYWAGYKAGEVGAPGGVPPDLASACLELAAWNMTRYRGRRIGITGSVRGSGKEGEHLEASMPENVRLLLEPYQRRVI